MNDEMDIESALEDVNKVLDALRGLAPPKVNSWHGVAFGTVFVAIRILRVRFGLPVNDADAAKQAYLMINGLILQLDREKAS